MGSFRLEDLTPVFYDFWQQWSTAPINVQVEQWAHLYSEKFPELFHKLIDSYETDGTNWRQIAQTHVFPLLPHACKEFDKIVNRLKMVIPWVYKRLNPVFNVDFDIYFLIYIGIGVGAGWATSYKQIPAVFFGIENIVECGWLDKDSLQALAAHEVGHLVHQHWRQTHKIPIEYSNPYWQLYEEGFAMRCEHRIMGYDSWHEKGENENWVTSCKSQISMLARRFLNVAEDHDEVRRFFGSWYEIDGLSQTGYFLGHEIIRLWEQNRNFEEIALMPLQDIINNSRKWLSELANSTQS